jgi:hypothetical protein
MEIWEKLLDKAIRCIMGSQIPPNTENKTNWSLGGGYIKLYYKNGEIDFIVADRLLDTPYENLYKQTEYNSQIPKK